MNRFRVLSCISYKKYTGKSAHGLNTGWQAQRSGLPSERRNSGMDEGWAAQQTGTRNMELVTTTELSAETHDLSF